MEWTEVILVVLTGIAAGAMNTLAGGGSLITLPLLIFLGFPPTVANGTNRVAVFVQNIFGAAGYRSKGVSAWPYSGWLGLAALAGSLIGAGLAVEVSGELFNRILAVVMLIVVFLTAFNPVHGNGACENLSGRRTAAGMATFFFIGIYGGFIQAGVGFMIIAALVHINGFSLVKANSAKVLVVLIYTLAALAVFVIDDKVNWQAGGTLAVGNAIGAWFASRWSVEKGDRWIRGFLLASVSAMAIKLWFF